MADANDAPTPPVPGGPPTRFEVTVQSPPSGPSLAAVADLDLDRVPDPHGGVRLVVTADELRRLEASGYEVEVQAELAVQPLDPGLVLGDEEARRWLDERLAGLGGTEAR